MDNPSDERSTLPPEDAVGKERELVRLYVAGHGPRAEEAWQTVRTACKHLRSHRLDVELVDVCERPEAAVSAGIVFTPTLVLAGRGPERRWLGDFTSTDAVTRALSGDDA